MESDRHVPGMLLWGFMKAWEIQEHYCRNKFTGILVMHMLSHYGEQYLKAQLEKNDKREEHIIHLQAKVTDNHKEIISHQKKLKPILEGMENNK